MTAFPNKQKRLIAVALFAWALTAYATATPASTIDAFFEALQRGDLEATNAFLTPTPPPTEMGDDEKIREMATSYFSRIRYEIQEVVIEDGKATVSMTLHYPDKGPAGAAMIKMLMGGTADRLAGGKGVTSDDIAVVLSSIYQDEELALLSKETEVVLAFDDGWKILGGENNADFFNTVLNFIPE